MRLYTAWWRIGAERKKMKLGDELLQSLKLSALSILVCVLLTGCRGASTQDKLYRQVQELAALSGDADRFDVLLSDLTEFDWDEAVVFQYPASRNEMEEATGIAYRGSLDLTYGIIFAKEKKIVYEELFPMDFEAQSRFMIYPHSGDDIGSKPHFGVFAPDSVFTCTITESGDETCYSVKPVEMPVGRPNR